MKNSFTFSIFAIIQLFSLSTSAPTQPEDVLPRRVPTATIQGNQSPAFALRASAPSATSCPTKEEKCTKKCFSKDWYRDRETCDCRPCPVNQKANAANNGCEPDQDYEKTKGKCGYGTILDPAEGGQDQNTQKPACVPDDRDLCKEGTVPKSRGKTSTEVLDETSCAPDIKEEDKPKCKSNEYRFMEVWESDGGNTKSAKYKCQKTRKFSRDKQSKFDGVKQKKQPEYDEKKRREAEDRKKWEDEMKKKEEEDVKNRKKSRMGQCLMIVALSLYSDDALVDYAIDFFDEDFVSGEFLMAYWPSDMTDVPADGIDINTEEYMQQFVDAISDDAWIVNHIGPGKRSDGREDRLENTNVMVSHNPTRDISLEVRYEKRWIQAVIAAIGGFLTRLGPIVARVGSGVARLAKLIKKGGAKLAKAGQSKAKSQKDQENAADSIAKNKNWDNCLRGKAPDKN